MAVTIKDVAKQAKVSPSTVSRVISDSPKISEKTKRKVRKVMEELGYHLNYNARVLVQQSTKTIGIVMKNATSESLHNPFVPEVIKGISAMCRKQDFSISLTTGESEEAIFQDVVKMVQGKRVDGMIVLYSKKDDKVVPYLVEQGIPSVVIGKPLMEANKISSVDNDNVEAAKEATNHLIELGHERIGLIDSDFQFEVAEARFNGFSQAIRGNNLEFQEKHVANLQLDPDQGKDIIAKIMQADQPPTAFVVTDDLIALMVLSALRDLNLKVPEDVSIISFNNSIIAQLSNPPLTSIDTQIFKLGYESARCLLEQLNDPSMFNKSVIIPTFIEERESCQALQKEKNSM